MENALVVLLMCTGVFALPPDYVLHNRILIGDAQLQGGALVLLAAPAQGQLLVVPSPKSKGVEDYDEGVEDSKDWKEEEIKSEGREEHDDGQYDPKKYEGTEDYNDAAETEKSEVIEDYNEKSEDEGKYEATTTESTTNQDEQEGDSGMYKPDDKEEKVEPGKYIPGKDEEQDDDTGKYDPGKYEEKREEAEKDEGKSEDSGQYQPNKYDEKDDSEKKELGKYQQDDSGKYEPGKYEENVLDGSASNAQNAEARNSENREGKSSQEGVEQHEKTKDADTKRETAESGAKPSNDKGSNGKSVHVPEEIVVGSINKPQEEKTEVKSEDDEGVPAVVKVAPPVKETEVVQLAPVVYHVSPKLIQATQPQ